MLTRDGGALTWTGFDQFVQPLAALAMLTQTWRCAGSQLRPTQATQRLRPASIDETMKLAASPVLSGTPCATGMRLAVLPPFGSSRNVSWPVASGVPTLRKMLLPAVPQLLPPRPSYSAWKTLPVTWSIDGYPSAPNSPPSDARL